MAEEKENARTGAARNGLAPVGVSSGPSCGYIPTIPEGDKVEFQLGNEAYAVPTGDEVLFELKCDVALEEIGASGSITSGSVVSSGEALHYENIIVGGKPHLDNGTFETDIVHAQSFYDSTIGSGDITIDGKAEVFTAVSGKWEFGVTSTGSAEFFREVRVERIQAQDLLFSNGFVAAQAFISGDNQLQQVTSEGRADTIDYPFIGGVIETPITSDGHADVLNSARGIASAPLAIQSEGLVEVLFNITGNVQTGDIKSESQRVEVLTLIEGRIGGDIKSDGKAEFVGILAISGSVRTGDIASTGSANQGNTVEGRSSLSIEGEGALEVRWFGMVEEHTFSTDDITATGRVDFYSEVKVADAVLSIRPNTITGSGKADHYQEVRVTGTVPIVIDSAGFVDNINLVRGIDDKGQIESSGEAEFTKPKDGLELRYVYGWIRHGSDKIASNGRIVEVENVEGRSLIGDITSTSGIIASYVEVMDSSMRFSDGINFLTGRTEFGFGDEERIDQIYEVSTSRSMDIPLISPDPRYAVKLNTTDFNLTETELRRGTTVFEFRFDYDYPDIKQIEVWLETEDGRYTLDTMRWADRRFNTRAPHILSAPIRAVVPVHCIGKKSNQFVLELEFTEEGQARYLRPSESYLIPFQAHFDNRNPYINIADHEALLGYGSETTTLIAETDSLQVVRYVYEDMLEGGPYGSRCTTVMAEYDELKLTTLVYEDEFWTRLHSGNTYLNVEHVDLSNINIGG
nr:MAG TPA: hypothetical protein [Caudoviricetes sp.]